MTMSLAAMELGGYERYIFEGFVSSPTLNVFRLFSM